MSKEALVVTHLFFANSNLLLLQVENRVEEKIKSILEGQMINYDKFALLFGKNMQQEKGRSFYGEMKMRLCEGEGKYLGLLYLVGRSNKQFF